MATDIKTILKIHVPLVVEIGRRNMSLDNVLRLGPGAILELDKSSEENLDLMINNIPVGQGQAMKVGENFGVRIVDIGSAQKRLSAMSQSG